MMALIPIFSSLIGIALIFYSYKNRKSATTKLLPSLYFLKQLKPNAPRSKKRKLPFRFFLELIFILLLASLLLISDTISNKKRYRLIIDVSESMGAKANDSTRLDNAKNELRSLLTSFNTNSEYYLETTPSSKIKKEFVSKDAALNIINKLEVIPLPDDYAQLVGLDSPLTETLIFTDKKALGDTISQRYVFFTPSSNLALSSVHINGKDSGSTLTINYLFSGSGSNAFDLLLEEVKSKKVITKSRGEILSPGPGSITLQLTEALNKKEIYKAYIKNTLQLDSLRTDNEIFFKPNESNDPEILLVGSEASNQSSLESLKEILPGSSKFILEQDLTNLKTEEKSNSPLIIYYKTKGPEEIFAPSLFITPNTSTTLLEIKGVISSPKISSWSGSSQVTRYINFESLNLTAALKLQETPWGNPILRVNGATSIIEGQLNDLPVIVSGLELLPFEGKKSPAASIMLLNMIKKLSSNNFVNTSVNAITLTSDESAENLITQANFQAHSTLPTGAYTITSPKNNRIDLSNSYNLNESDTRTLNEEIIGIKTGISRPKILESDILFYLAISSIFILVLDLVLILILGREV